MVVAAASAGTASVVPITQLDQDLLGSDANVIADFTLPQHLSWLVQILPEQ